MTVLAWKARRDVVHRFRHDPPDPAHARGMTGRAAGRDPRVIHRGPRKRGRGLVTGLAGRGGREVVRRLAQRRGPVMTARAVGRIPRVIKRGHPRRKRGHGFMTVLTRKARRDVSRRLRHNPPDPALARRMTGRAARRDPRVIHHGPRKRGRGLVTGLAGWERRGGRRDVGRRLAQRRGTVMTGRAARRDPRVIVSAGRKNPVTPHLVATITRCGSHQVGRRLSTGLDPVMTGRAGAWHNSKMPEGQAGPGNSPMAVVAGHSRRNVRYGLSLCGTIIMAL